MKLKKKELERAIDLAWHYLTNYNSDRDWLNFPYARIADIVYKVLYVFGNADQISQNMGVDKETMKYGLQKYMEEKGKSEADLVEGFTSCTGSLVTSGAWSRPDCSVTGNGCADGSCGLDGSGSPDNTSGGGGDATVDSNDYYLDTLSDYEAAIAATKNCGKPLIVLYTTSYCGPCKHLKPIYQGMISEFPDLVMKVVDESNRDAIRQARV